MPSSAAPRDPSQDPVRLQVLLARCGLGSRRACEEFIRAGRITIDGNTMTELGTRIDPASQTVCLDDEPLRPERRAVYMVNKPKGMLCTNRDPSGRPRVIDLFPESAGRVFPVGRLDEDSVGLLLVTNDGELSHRLAHPRFRVVRTYQVQVAGVPSPETIRKLREGVYFSDGKFKLERVRKIQTRGKSAVLEVTLSEGQNREIRRLLARLGHKVMRLERMAFGPLELRQVPVGSYRSLTKEELKRLNDFIANAEQRIAEDRKQTQQSQARRSSGPKPVRQPKRIVEVSPLGQPNAGRDLTGRRRDGRPERREGRPEQAAQPDHPAIVRPGKPRPGSRPSASPPVPTTRKPRKRRPE